MGLKFVVQVSTGVSEHLNAFNSVMHYYELITGVKIDRSGKDVTRLCFVSFDPNAYYNPNARVFEPLSSAGKGVEVVRPLKTVPPAGEDPFVDLYGQCIAQTLRFFHFVEGQRNEFVFHLALQLRKAGQDERFTLSVLLQDYNFNEREVRACVRSAYSYAISDAAPGSRVIYKPVQQPPTGKEDPQPGPRSVSQNDATNGVKSVGYPSATTPGKKAKVKKTDKQADNDTVASSDQIDQPAAKPKKIKGQQYTLEAVEAYIRKHYETRNNLVTGMVEWRVAHSNAAFIQMDDNMVNSLFCDLHHMYQFIPINTLHILLNSKFSPPVNPFIDYFYNLDAWDGVTDYIGQLVATVKTHDDLYWDRLFRKWFVAMVASLLVDKIINHNGHRACWRARDREDQLDKIVTSGMPLKEYVGTTTLLTDSKDTSIQLSECALIILDELESLNRKDLANRSRS